MRVAYFKSVFGIEFDSQKVPTDSSFSKMFLFVFNSKTKRFLMECDGFSFNGAVSEDMNFCYAFYITKEMIFLLVKTYLLLKLESSSRKEGENRWFYGRDKKGLR